MGSSDEAEDVAQEVFVKAWQALDSFRPGGSLGSWLYRITVNAAIDATRRRRPQVNLDDIAPPPSEQYTERSVLDAEEAERVRRAVRHLPPASRAALVLREYEQLSYAEIGAEDKDGRWQVGHGGCPPWRPETSDTPRAEILRE